MTQESIQFFGGTSIFSQNGNAYRDAIAGEAAVLATLAKIDPAQLNFAARDASAHAESSQQTAGQITLVVGEGLQVELPMAGQHPLCSACFLTLACRDLCFWPHTWPNFP